MTSHDTIFLSCLCLPLNLPETNNVQVATASQFFISYTIRTFGALTFAAIMTTRQVKRKLDLSLNNLSS